MDKSDEGCKLDWDFVTLNINLGRHNYLFVTNL